MKIGLMLMGTAALAVVPMAGCAVDATGESEFSKKEAACEAKEFTVTSPDFADGAPLPSESTCEGAPFGAGVSPELNWKNAPKGTKSFAIVFADTTLLDAGLPNFGYHWAIWNIPKNATTLPSGIYGLDPDHPAPVALPKSLKGASHTQARGVERFFGPCPSWPVAQAEICGLEPVPARTTDQYAFIVYALPDKKIEVPAYDSTVNANYVDTLSAYFTSIAIGQTEITATADAVPTTSPVPCPGPT
jgi:phosphatidylethanolamine-binding protein (PEBP) family uncharacterized protein